jgi:ribonuclease E
MDDTQDFAGGSPPGDGPRSAELTGGLPIASDVERDVDGEADGGTDDLADAASDEGSGAATRTKKRRRGTRGGRGRRRPAGTDGNGPEPTDGDEEDAVASDAVNPVASDDTQVATVASPPRSPAARVAQPELPEPLREGRPSAEAAQSALVPRKPKIGDTRPAAPPPPPRTPPIPAATATAQGTPHRKTAAKRSKTGPASTTAPSTAKSRTPRGGKASVAKHGAAPHQAVLDEHAAERRRGRERKGRPIGRYMMCVHVGHGLTQVAVLEGRSLMEHYVSRPADDISQIHGNIYVGRVQNVLPGMEAAFVDIGTPKNAVLYAGDVQYDPEDIVERSSERPRIEQVLKNRQLILSQVTKNPIGAKGARLTQEVSLPGRFVVLIPNSKTYGISKRLPDDERRRLRSVLDRVKEAEHGLIVRTAAEHATEEELRADVMRLNETWREIERRSEQARKQNRPQLLYREPDLAVRVIREEFNAEYRSIVIDDRALFDEVRSYVAVMNPELADRIEYYDPEVEGLPLYERFHVHEQLHKALDRKVWLPSGGSLIIEHTEALTVIDVNTGKNVGSSSLEATVLHNNLEAAEEIARQLRLRDIGGIIVIDFIDMEIKENRRKVVDAFRDALARDKTRSQVFEISELGLVEMTRKRIGEGLLSGFADHCPHCEGRGVAIDYRLLE